MTRFRFFTAVACGCLWAAASLGVAQGYRPRVGQPHPDFVLPHIDDRAPVSLSQFRGQKVLLIQFASW